MARILDNPNGNTDRAIVEYVPEELLPKVFGAERAIGDELKSTMTIASAIQAIAWKDLWANAPHIVKGKEFKYSNCTVIDGLYVVTFYTEMPEIKSPQPEAR